MKNLIFLWLTIMLAACGSSSQKRTSQSVSLTGAGATFPLPYYNLAFKSWQDTTGISVTYGGIGSGGGIRSLKDRIVDFGGSDAFLTDAELKEMPGHVLQIPTCIGAVVLAYHLPEVKDLKLTGELIADIYLGKITRWNAPQLQTLNPHLRLPDLPIYPVYRSDGSGTTYVFSDYLSKVSSDWKNNVGTGKSLQWATGIAAKGNPGVAGSISQTTGAIGYIGSEYALALKIPVARLQNQAGKFIVPTAESISAAAHIAIPADTRIMLTNSAHPEAYPISCFTWLALYQEQAYNDRSQAQAQALAHLFTWLIQPQAQTLTTKVHYSPLPENVVRQAQSLLHTLTYDGKPLLK